MSTCDGPAVDPDVGVRHHLAFDTCGGANRAKAFRAVTKQRLSPVASRSPDPRLPHRKQSHLPVESAACIGNRRRMVFAVTT